MTQKTSHRKLWSVSGFLLLFLQAIHCFHHCGEVNQKHAAEMTAVCNEWWGLIAKLLTKTSRRCFCREAWSQWSRLGIWTMTAKGKACCLLLPPLDPKPWWHRKDLLQKPGLGKECCEVRPLTGHWCFCTLQWLGHHQGDERHHNCTPSWRKITGGVAHTVICFKALYLWVPEHRLYGVFLLVKKDTMFV